MSATLQPPEGAALVILGPEGLDLARRVARRLPGAGVHGPAGSGAGETYAGTADHLRSLFAAGVPIVGVMAAGILIRALAPVIGDKGTGSPVVALSRDGGTAVPLLGGHDGANRLALAVADASGGSAAITTAGDVMLGLALDDPPPGWRVANRGAAKGVAAALLAGEPVALLVEAGDAAWLQSAPFAEEGRLTVRLTDKAVSGGGDELVLHPPVLALGVGCERGVDAGELAGLAGETLAGAGLATDAVACVASLDLKSDEEAVHALARDLGVPARFFTAEDLEAEAGRLANPSDAVFDAAGCHGVAEGAALAAAGEGGVLIVEKTKSARATCAVARAPGCIEPNSTGRPRGRLAVVGIGPGGAPWRTPEASGALAGAAHVVGYGLYLDLIADAITGKTRHETTLGEEEERATMALDLAALGESVALVSSGDPGIFALASLVFELLEQRDHGPWSRVDITVVPGISAFQAAAARMGAPMGHDFCVISLSDLLTPWAAICRRLQAAAEGDFIVALYNPASARRKAHLAEARDILLMARAQDTPVMIGRNLGREGEHTEITCLGRLDSGSADMLSVILIGNSRTRVTERGTGRWVYTPRGYEVSGQ